ncbi:MAG: leucine--tRNA ligase, partial [Candidatus Bathyarchaeia archaeon]
INPNAEYVKAKVDTENWIVTRECVEKLKFLSRTVHVEQSLPGRDLLSLKTVNPADNRRIPILPAEFVNPKDVTGVVMSVPAHAPYDYMALEDIRKGRTDLSAYNIPPTSLQSLKPLPVISVKGYSAIPAADVTGTMGIKDQHDSHLEDATREVYRREFHEGAMLDHIPKYGGMPVAEAKEAIRADLTENGNAEVMFELQNKPVICRCGAECVVKIFEKQWFLNYGDTQWKELAYKCIENMSILPEHMRTEFKHVVDWLKEKACARKSGLGTKLPWDQDWIIESLSDSTIYMAYYTIAKHLNQAHIPAENLTHAVFDYVFLGIGDVKDIASQSGVSLELLQQMQQEFQYFYPLDVRHSGRDLVSNHLTYFIFNHVALFPPSLWPREIAVNGSVLMEGEKMSKSLGNILPLGDAIDAYGADALRVSLLGTAGLLHDADFSPSLARSTRERLERLLERVERVRGEDATHLDELSLQHLDLWLLSRVQGHIKATSEAMNELETMKACQSALYSLDRDVEWYNNRTTHTAKDPAREETVRTVLREVLRIQTLLLTPFAPHGCEEMWEMLGGAGFAAMASWPQPREDRINIPAEESEGIVGTIIEDVNSIIRATDIKPQKIWIYTSADWKWNIYLNAINYASKSQTDQASFLKEIKSTTAFTMKPKECIKLAQKFLQSAVRTSRDLLDRKCTSGRLPEFNILREAQGFLSRHFGVEVEVYDEEDPQRYDPKRRATLAEPRRPAIYIE